MSGDAKHEIYQRRGARNRAVLWALAGFVALMFFATIFQMEKHVHPNKHHKTPNHAENSDAG